MKYTRELNGPGLMNDLVCKIQQKRTGKVSGLQNAKEESPLTTLKRKEEDKPFPFFQDLHLSDCCRR